MTGFLDTRAVAKVMGREANMRRDEWAYLLLIFSLPLVRPFNLRGYICLKKQ